MRKHRAIMRRLNSGLQSLEQITGAGSDMNRARSFFCEYLGYCLTNAF